MVISMGARGWLCTHLWLDQTQTVENTQIRVKHPTHTHIRESACMQTWAWMQQHYTQIANFSWRHHSTASTAAGEESLRGRTTNTPAPPQAKTRTRSNSQTSSLTWAAARIYNSDQHHLFIRTCWFHADTVGTRKRGWTGLQVDICSMEVAERWTGLSDVGKDSFQCGKQS